MTATPNDETARWYVLSANYRSEVKIRDDLRRLGFDCYLPMRYELKERMGKKKRVLVPAINGLVFVKSLKSALEEYIATTKLPTFFRMSGLPGQKKPIVVPDRDMENFIRVTQLVEEQLTYYRPEEIRLRVGDRIKVHGGVFDGVEGVLMRVPGKRSKQLVVSIPELAAVAVTVSPDVVELVDRTTGKSTDVEGDLKALFELAFRKLFAAPDRITQENEYNLLTAELKRTLERVRPHKGYTAQREGEISLAVFMGAKALGEDGGQEAERLKAAVDRLKGTSLLRLRLQLYYAVLGPDSGLMAAIGEKVDAWSKSPLSEQQRRFIEEWTKVSARPPQP
jgi:transcription antitermination factor NusG